tara:strand:+ start:6326 stop:8863 length:2538 start_codon:yes stop_codon:yes gene_type:complete
MYGTLSIGATMAALVVQEEWGCCSGCARQDDFAAQVLVDGAFPRDTTASRRKALPIMSVVCVITITTVQSMIELKKTISDVVNVRTRWRRVLIVFAAAPLVAWCAIQTPLLADPVSRTKTPHSIESAIASSLPAGSAETPIHPTPVRPAPIRPTPIRPTPIRPSLVDPTPIRPVPGPKSTLQGSGLGLVPPLNTDSNAAGIRGVSDAGLTSRLDAATTIHWNRNGANVRSEHSPSATAVRDDLGVPPVWAPRTTDTPNAIVDHFEVPTFDVAIVDPPNISTSITSAPENVDLHRGAADVPSVPNPINHGPWAGQLDHYRVRADELPDQLTMNGVGPVDSSGQPLDIDVWWQTSIAQPMGLSPQALPIDIATVTQTALVSSPYVQGILAEPKIRQNDVVIADAEFDTLAFIEAKFANTNEPVGSELTTGDNSDRFRDETFSSSAGVRKKTRGGGNLELVQRGGFQDNNSTFLVPNPQGTSRLELNFTQPLLRDHGRAVNNTRVLLAQIDLQVSRSEVRDELEEHLLNVTTAYWELYQARAEWLQRSRLLEGANHLRDILLARQAVDAYRRQILRAQAAVAQRRSDLIRAETRVRNAQAQLRVLTGDPRLARSAMLELTPQDVPLAYPVNVSTRQATITALDHRNDIAAAIREIQAVSARVGAARNQVLPRLDLILGTYVAGLDGKTDTFGAIGNQFSDGGASYAAGLLFEIPVANRASRARLARNQWEMKRTLYRFQQTTEMAFAEVEIAVRETRATFDEMATKKQSIDASENEVNYLRQRWELLPDPNESPVLLIEDLLDAQERLADEERSFVRAQVAYAMSWVQLRKATGVLLQMNHELTGFKP